MERLQPNETASTATSFIASKKTSDNSSNTRGKSSSAEVTPLIRFMLVSSIEYGHSGPIMSLQWLSQRMQINHNGEIDAEQGRVAGVAANKSVDQFITVSTDAYALIWDLRYRKDLKSLDLVWRPLLRISITSLDGTTDYGCTRVCLKCPVISEHHANLYNTHEGAIKCTCMCNFQIN